MDSYHKRPFHLVVLDNDLKKVQQLIDNGLRVNKRYRYGHTHLHTVAYWGTLEMVQLLIANGARVYDEGRFIWIPLYWAICRKNLEKNLEMIQLLLGNGATVNVQDRFGERPLHWAVMYGDFEMVQLLIYNGADPEIRSLKGETVYDLLQNKKDEINDKRTTAEMIYEHRENYLAMQSDFNDILQCPNSEYCEDQIGMDLNGKWISFFMINSRFRDL